MDLGIFTWITGIATLLGFMLQVRDVLPKYRETRKAVLLTTLGVFIGTIIGSLQRVSIQFSIPITGFVALVGAGFSFIVFLVVTAMLTSDTHKRGQIFGAAGIGTFIFVFILLFGTLITHVPTQEERESKTISIDELLLLANVNVERHNIDRAIMLLEQAGGRLQNTDPRYGPIKSRIEALKKEQVYPAKQKPGS